MTGTETAGNATNRSQIVIISSIDWSAAWQRHQIFAAQWAKAGHEVFFIENSGFRNPGWTDLPRLRKKIVEWIFPPRIKTGPSTDVRIAPPRVLPPRGKLFRLFNRHLLLPSLVERLRRAGLRDRPLVIAYFPTATSLDLISLLAPCAVVYDCASNFRAHKDAPPDFAELERALLAVSDCVVCDSDFLYRQKKAEHPNVVQIHQGVPERFLKAGPGGHPPKSFCYYGTWGPDLAPEYLQALLDEGFDVTVSGFFKGDHAPLPAGVTRLAPTAPDKLVERLEHFDAFLMPYRITPFHLGVIPAKIYECLAMGRPVLATPLPSLEPYRDLIHLAEDPREWARLARDLGRTETPELRDKRAAMAREHTYPKEFERFQACVAGALAARAQGTSCASPPAPLPRQLQAFVKGFSWIGLLYGLAKISILVTQVLAGRLLGPVEYGMANLVLAVSAFLQILPTMGFPIALSKFLSSETSEEMRHKLVATALTSFLVWGLLFLGICLNLRGPLSALLAVPVGLFLLALLYSFSNAFYVVVSSPLLGLQRFRERGFTEMCYGLGAPLLFLLFAAHGPVSHRDMILALAVAFGLGSLHSIWRLRDYLRPRFHAEAFKPIFKYAFVATLNLLTLACILAPARLILNHCHTPHDVGIFSAYFTSTAQVSLSLLYMLTAVLIPISSDKEGQRQAWDVFRRIRLPLAGIGLAGLTLAACAALFLFGQRYPFRLDWAVTFAAAGTLIMTHGIAADIFSARDFTGLRVSVGGSLTAGAANLLLCLALIPRWGISGAAVSLLGAYILGLGYYALFGLKGTFWRT